MDRSRMNIIWVQEHGMQNHYGILSTLNLDKVHWLTIELRIIIIT